MTLTQLYSGNDLPHPSDIDLLVVMGGPMSIHNEEQYPWLKQEKKFIRLCLAEQVKIAGICLGAQMVADVLGATVCINGGKEIGWHPIEWSGKARQLPLFDFLPKQQKVLHWHGETFEIPEKGINLAVSSGCPRQGFLIENRVLGLQFHLEMTRSSLSKLIKNCRNELSVAGGFIQSAEEMLSEDQLFEQANASMRELMDRFIEL